MDVEDLLSTAWSAVEKAGIPPELQELAFKEAVSFLREGLGAPTARSAEPKHAPVGGAGKPAEAPSGQHGGSDFFAHLAQESGVSETDLRDVLSIAADGKVLVTHATTKLGATIAEQARTVIALVTSARGIGLREDPVDADQVRAECKRKRCYDSKNFANHLGALKGFNSGGRNQIVLTSKWPDEFKAAVAKAHGRANTGAGG